MSYTITKIDLEGFPVQYLDDDIVRGITESFLRNQPNISKLERMANGVNLKCDFGIKTRDGYSQFAKIFGILPVSRIGFDDDVNIIVLFPWIDQNEQRSVNIYASSELPKELMRRIAGVLTSYIDR